VLRRHGCCINLSLFPRDHRRCPVSGWKLISKIDLLADTRPRASVGGTQGALVSPNAERRNLHRKPHPRRADNATVLLPIDVRLFPEVNLWGARNANEVAGSHARHNSW
jgi:hypothetical protein